MSKTDADLGTLSEHEGEWQVTFVRRLHHPIEKVWRALTETEHMKAWFPDEMVGERRSGAPLKFISEQMNETYEGEMLVFEPQSVMELRGMMLSVPDEPPGTAPISERFDKVVALVTSAEFPLAATTSSTACSSLA